MYVFPLPIDILLPHTTYPHKGNARRETLAHCSFRRGTKRRGQGEPQHGEEDVRDEPDVPISQSDVTARDTIDFESRSVGMSH